MYGDAVRKKKRGEGMYFLFFAVWIIFNGRVTTEIVIFGLVIAAFMYAFVCRFMDYSPQKDLKVLKKTGQIISYAGVLIWEILKANVTMVKMILSSGYEIHPAVVHFKTDLKTKTAKVLLANSITLTPGTITVSLEEDELTVHCLDKSFGEGLEECIFVKKLRKLEQ